MLQLHLLHRSKTPKRRSKISSRDNNVSDSGNSTTNPPINRGGGHKRTVAGGFGGHG